MGRGGRLKNGAEGGKGKERANLFLQIFLKFRHITKLLYVSFLSH